MKVMSILDKLVGLGGPFAEGLAQSIVSETAPEVGEAGKEAAAWIKGKLLGTKTTADDTLIISNLKAFAQGFLDGLAA